MIHEPHLFPDKGDRHCNFFTLCFSWSAVVIGALIGFGLSFLLNLFSFAIGLTAFTPTDSGLMKLAVGGFIGLLIGGIITMFVSGWAAGYFARPHCRCSATGSTIGSTNCNCARYGIVYGFTAWCLALVISLFVAGYVGQFMASQPYLAGQSSAVATNVHTETMQTVAQKSNLNPPASVGTAQKNTELAAHNMGLSLLITFLVFFFGAVSSCFGGFFGMKSRLNKERVFLGNATTTTTTEPKVNKLM